MEKITADGSGIIKINKRKGGVIFEMPKQEDYVFGGVTGYARTPIFPDGHGWIKYQRPEERQFNKNFDSFSCVSFACLKALSYFIKERYGLDMDFSERFTAVMSGTIRGRGNSVRNVLESIRTDGFVLESDYPSMTDTMTEDEWFVPIPASVKKKGLENLKQWKINWETLTISDNVPHTQIYEGLKSAPVITTGFAWASYYGNPDDIGIYHDYNYQANHCFLLCDWQKPTDWDVLADDSYPQDNRSDDAIVDEEFLKRLAPDYRLWSSHQIFCEPIPQTNKKISFIKSMINTIWTWFETVGSPKGLRAYYVPVDFTGKPKGKQEINFDNPVEAVKILYSAINESGSFKKTSWPEIKPLEDKKFI